MKNGWLKNLLKKIRLSESTISKVLGLLVIVVVGALIFNYFRGVGKPEENEQFSTGQQASEEVKLVEEGGKLVPESLPTTHRVVKGETLWKIAEKYYGSGYNWIDIAKESKLKNPNVLLADQELTIPKTAVIKPEIKSPTAGTVAGATITGNQYPVEKGDSLWKIAVRAYGDGYQWVKIAQANNLKNPSLIHPGNTLALPR